MKKLLLLLVLIVSVLLLSCVPLTHVSQSPAMVDVYTNVSNIKFDQYGWSWQGDWE